MRNANNIHLDGTVTRCRSKRLDGGIVRADIVLVTLRPSMNPDWKKPSEAFDKDFHRVVVKADGEEGKALEELSELSTRGIDDIIPYSVDGKLVFRDGALVVECDGKGFKPCEEGILKASANNVVTMSGTVSDTPTFSDSSAMIKVDSSAGPVRVVIPRSSDEEWWKKVAGQEIGKGAKVSFSGPVYTLTMTNGSESIKESFITARKIQQLSLVKKTTQSRGL